MPFEWIPSSLVRRISKNYPYWENKISGRRDLNLRPPAPQAGALNHAALRPDGYVI